MVGVRITDLTHSARKEERVRNYKWRRVEEKKIQRRREGVRKEMFIEPKQDQ